MVLIMKKKKKKKKMKLITWILLVCKMHKQFSFLKIEYKTNYIFNSPFQILFSVQ